MVIKEEMELRDYLRVLRRRKRPMLIGFLATVALTALVVVFMPSSYRSIATIQIERQVVPDDWISNPANGFLGERLHALSQRIGSEENLRAIAEKYPVFSPGWEKNGDWLEDMRSAITMNKVDIQVADPNRRRSMFVTVAFNISFDGRTPEVAQQVTQELALLYLQDNEIRRTQTEEVVRFLREETERLGARVGSIAERISEFKREHLESLPELAAANRNFYERALGEVSQTRESIRSLEQRRAELSIRLAGTPTDGDVYSEDGRRVSTSSERLRLLRTEYARALAVYNDVHPDVRRLKAEIDALEAAGGGLDSEFVLNRQVEELQRKLDQMRQSRSAQHPDLQRLERQLRESKMELDRAMGGGSGSGSRGAPTNPTYITLQGEFASVEAHLRNERAKLSQLQSSVSDYEQRLYTSPDVEKEYQSLIREHDSVNAKYREMSDRLLDAQMSVQLGKEPVGDRFHLVRPAHLPSKPLNPQPLALMLFGTVLGVGSGVGAAAFSEYWDRGVRGRDGVRAVLNQQPLVVMPYVENRQETARRARRRYGRVVLLVLVVASVAILFYVKLGDSLVTGGSESANKDPAVEDIETHAAVTMAKLTTG